MNTFTFPARTAHASAPFYAFRPVYFPIFIFLKHVRQFIVCSFPGLGFPDPSIYSPYNWQEKLDIDQAFDNSASFLTIHLNL